MHKRQRPEKKHTSHHHRIGQKFFPLSLTQALQTYANRHNHCNGRQIKIPVLPQSGYRDQIGNGNQPNNKPTYSKNREGTRTKVLDDIKTNPEKKHIGQKKLRIFQGDTVEKIPGRKLEGEKQTNHIVPKNP